jgi:hypothetical protein
MGSPVKRAKAHFTHGGKISQGNKVRARTAIGAKAFRGKPLLRAATFVNLPK